MYYSTTTMMWEEGGKRRNALGYLPSKLHLKVAAAVFHEFFSQ